MQCGGEGFTTTKAISDYAELFCNHSAFHIHSFLPVLTQHDHIEDYVQDEMTMVEEASQHAGKPLLLPHLFRHPACHMQCHGL